MKQKFIDVFGKASLPDPKAWWSEYVVEFKKAPARRSVFVLLKTLVVLYFLMQLYPFLIDPPYLVVFLFTALPFIIFEKFFKFENYKIVSKTLPIETK